jgi:hypothetical protein
MRGAAFTLHMFLHYLQRQIANANSCHATCTRHSPIQDMSTKINSMFIIFLQMQLLQNSLQHNLLPN